MIGANRRQWALFPNPGGPAMARAPGRALVDDPALATVNRHGFVAASL